MFVVVGTFNIYFISNFQLISLLWLLYSPHCVLYSNLLTLKLEVNLFDQHLPITPPPPIQAATIILSVSGVCLFLEFILVTSYSIYLSLSDLPHYHNYQSIHFCYKCQDYLLFLLLCVFVYNIFFFISSFIDGHLGCFHTLAIVHSATMNIRYSFETLISFLFDIYPEIGFAGSHGSSRFNFMRNFHTVFQNDCTNSFPLRGARVSFCTFSHW